METAIEVCDCAIDETPISWFRQAVRFLQTGTIRLSRKNRQLISPKLTTMHDIAWFDCKTGGFRAFYFVFPARRSWHTVCNVYREPYQNGVAHILGIPACPGVKRAVAIFKTGVVPKTEPYYFIFGDDDDCQTHDHRCRPVGRSCFLLRRANRVCRA